MTHHPTALALLVALGLPALAPAQEPAPVFSDPTSITNPLAPFAPGSVKVFRGRSGGVRTTVVETHLEQTRVFALDGAAVACRILEEKQFERGALVEISWHYLAQDDAGNVRYFGEVSVHYLNGQAADTEDDSWLVGEPLPGDPPGVHSADAPTMYMPAAPQPGVGFSQQPFAAAGEVVTLKKVGVSVRVPAGRFTDALRFEEDDGEDGPQQIWVVPGIGMVRERGQGSRGELIATSLVEQEEVGAGG